MNKYTGYTKIICFMLLLVGCTTSPSTPSPSSVAPTAPPPLTASNGTLTLTILSPADHAVVSASVLEIRGRLSADSTLTIGSDKYILPPGDFTQTFTLEEGQNSIPITAEGLLGFKVELTLTVTYQP